MKILRAVGRALSWPWRKLLEERVAALHMYLPPEMRPGGSGTRIKQLRESATQVAQPTISRHKTPVDGTGSWDGPANVAAAPAEAKVLGFMHAIFRGGEADKKANYDLPHHGPTVGAAVIAGVNEALARLPGIDIDDAVKREAEAHLRGHRRDAGLEESMSPEETALAVRKIASASAMALAETEALERRVREQEMSHDDLRRQLRLLLNPGDDWRRYIVDVFSTHLIYEDGESLFRIDYKVSDTEVELVGDPVEVRLEYVPVTQNPTEAMREIREAMMPLAERALAEDKTVLLKIIKPGWGSSGYYGEAMLKRDGPGVFVAGTPNYWDHPTAQQERERPEGSLRDFVGRLVEDAHWETEPEGPGLYARARAVSPFADQLDELASLIGTSIRAFGEMHPGEAEGRQGEIIDRLVAAQSVDYVTAPGAGGKVVELLEAAKTRVTVPAEPMADPTADEKLAEAIKRADEADAKAKAADEENARLKEAGILKTSRELVDKQLAEIKNIPDVTKTRIAESVSKNPPIKDQDLDEAALKAAVTEALKAEAEYLASVMGKKEVTGFGESSTTAATPEQTEEAQKALAESFQKLGLSEDASKIAAGGRD